MQASLQARWPLLQRRTVRASSRPAASSGSRPAAPAAAAASARSSARSARCRASSGNDDAPTTATTTTTATKANAALSTADFDEAATPPPGCARYKVSVKKPLGLVFEQDTRTLVVTVASLSPEGAAERAGVGIGDQLIAVSGIVYDKTEEYGEVQVKKGQQRVRVAARGETLKTLGAAISSHPGNWDVNLEFQRCEGGPVGSPE
jgi:hypothetical protein